MKKHVKALRCMVVSGILTAGMTTASFADTITVVGATQVESESAGVVVAGSEDSSETQIGPGTQTSSQEAAPTPGLLAPETTTQEDLGAVVIPTTLPQVDTTPAENAVQDAVIQTETISSYGALTNVSLWLNGLDGTISYGVYVNNGGFLPWQADGIPAGGTEESTYVETIQIALSGNVAKEYDVYYRGVSAYAGQHGWAKNEELMGTIDRNDYLTSVEVVVVPKDSGAPGSTEGRFYSEHSEYISLYSDGATYYVNGVGYTGWADHDQARYYFVDGQSLEGWQYIDGLKFYFNPTGALVMDVEFLIGQQSSYQLHVNKSLNCLTVYAQDGANGYILPVKSMLISVGDDTPVGTHYTPAKYRWRLMVNDTYTQYATRITAGFLFHSITYETTNENTLFNYGYNRLGVVRSLGCVRLTCANAKWIYDNCAIGTTVVVYEDETSVGPFFKPYQVWIPESQTYDPTDPLFAEV